MLAPPVPRVREVEERPIFSEEALRHVKAHLGSDTDAAEVGDIDGEPQLAVQRPEIAWCAPHARAREDVLRGLGLRLQSL
eukprot:9415104-Alexandrium_andersonii.AAC.1